MAKTKVSEWSTTPASNTDIDGINIAEGCAPSGINDAIRDLMAQVRSWQSGATGDPFNGPVNGTVGATTPSTGAFTTLSASSTVTLSGGTANGVLYLNGSKVVTSGSALTFDGTNFVVGYTSAGNIIAYTGGSIKVNRADNATNNEIKYVTSGDLFYFNQANGGAYQFNISGSEQMRLTSTGLGIGTSSPAQKLHVVAAGGYNSTFSENSANKVRLQFYIDANEAALVSGYDTTAKPMTFYTGGSKVATLDTSGNLGLGVTPSAWTTYKALQVNSSLALMGDGAASIYGNNAYYNGGWKYANSNYAALYVQNNGGNGAHAWYTAPSGTAGNAITLTQAMTLTAGGNLLVGTTTNFGSKAVVSAANGTAYSSTPQLRISGGGTNNNRAAILFSDDALQDGKISYYPAASAANSYFSFSARSTESDMILDGSGNLLVGATSNVTNAARLLVQTASDYQLTLNASTSSGSVYSAMNFTQAGTTKAAIYQDHANTRLTLQCNGSGGVYLASGATSWTANSDERLKTDLKLIENAAEKVSTLRAYTGRYKTDDEAVSRAFLIAQDVQAVLPEAVTSGTLARSEDTTEYLGVAYTEVIPLLVAAIKELKAEFDAYKASHP